MSRRSTSPNLTLIPYDTNRNLAPIPRPASPDIPSESGYTVEWNNRPSTSSAPFQAPSPPTRRYSPPSARTSTYSPPRSPIRSFGSPRRRSSPLGGYSLPRRYSPPHRLATLPLPSTSPATVIHDARHPSDFPSYSSTSSYDHPSYTSTNSYSRPSLLEPLPDRLPYSSTRDLGRTSYSSTYEKTPGWTWETETSTYRTIPRDEPYRSPLRRTTDTYENIPTRSYSSRRRS